MDPEMYRYDLPQQLIAQEPASPRDHARLLVYELAAGRLHDSVFYELPDFLKSGTALALNNSKVEPCRWLFDEGRTELFVLEKNDPHTIRAMVRPGRRFKQGKTVRLIEGITAEVIAVDEDGLRTLRLSVAHNDDRLKPYEHVPMPPYVQQNDNLAEEYQTVYAKPSGSLAAPTAGLHFTTELLAAISAGHPIAELTLHVGLGTFARLTQKQLQSGKLHEEWYTIPASTARVLGPGQHITAVGTTSVRALESAADQEGIIKPKSGPTDIFIQPGYKFKAVDAMITNFHLPSTSLLMLVAAFIADKRGLNERAAARELIRVYRHAIKAGYRFYSFGDAMLLT